MTVPAASENFLP
jgi:hypothetical protein